jgi:arginine deiminase
VFAFAPGRIIGYDCNVATMEAFDRAGYRVQSAHEFLEERAPADGEDRLFVGVPGINLARGGGGPRCMTLPIRRDRLS